MLSSAHSEVHPSHCCCQGEQWLRPPLPTWQPDQYVTLIVSGQTPTTPAELLNTSLKVKQNFSRIWSWELIVCAVFSADRFCYAAFSQVWCDFTGYLCGRSPALLHNMLNIWYVIIQAYYSTIFKLYMAEYSLRWRLGSWFNTPMIITIIIVIIILMTCLF